MSSTTHLTDGDLRALLDGEVIEPRRGELSRHLAGCALCAARRDALQQSVTAAEDLLDLFGTESVALDVDRVIRRARGGRVRRPRLVAAAVAAALLIATAAGATIGRPYVRAAATTIWKLVRGQGRPSRATESLQGGVAMRPGPQIEIAFAATQPDGVLVVAVADTADLWVRSTAPVAYRVGFSGVRVDNRASWASYEIIVPQDAADVRITVGGRVVFTKTGPRISSEAQPDSAGRYVLPVR